MHTARIAIMGALATASACKASPNESTAPMASAPVASLTAAPTATTATAATVATAVTTSGFVERTSDGRARIRALSATEQREREKQSLDALRRGARDTVQPPDAVTDPY